MTRSFKRRTMAAMAVSFATLAACRYNPTPVPLEASAADIEALAGRWEGTYQGQQSGRSGNIVFIIKAGKDTAYGDVLMFAESAGRIQRVIAADVSTGEHVRHSPSSDLLRVSFVSVHGGVVEGALEPYIAPDCNCTVTTVFRGAVEGNSIRGEYLTTAHHGLRQTGKWSVKKSTAAEE
jgi:hypothetical protein